MTIAATVCDTAAQLAQRVASEVAELILAHQGPRPFSLVLAGGRTPRLLYETLVREHGTHLDWQRLLIFFGDERCVPPTHADSNYRMAHDCLLSQVPIPAGSIHRMQGELPQLEAANAYAAALRRTFCVQGNDTTNFDLVLLGMGTDGHTASLFPGHSALKEMRRWVVGVAHSAVVPPTRLSLTLPCLQSAKRLWFMVTGSDKAPILGELRRDPGAAAMQYPAAELQRLAASRVHWYVDAAAWGPTALGNRPS